MNPDSRRSKTSGGSFTIAHWILFGLFVVALILSALGNFVPLPIKAGWSEVFLVLFATVTTLVALSRQLPGQTVLLAAIVIAVIGGLAHLLNAFLEIPFGRFTYTNEAGPQFYNALSWSVPFLWVIAVLNARGVARLILRPWRKIRIYGFWLIGLTAILTLLFDFGLEPFATRVKHYWLWSPNRVPFDWYGAPVVNFIGWMVTTLLIMGFATPILIKKKPAKLPVDYSPLLVWVLLNLLFIAGTMAQQLWWAVGLGITACLLATTFAIRGARW
jgi:uncharacterized membrane protein